MEITLSKKQIKEASIHPKDEVIDIILKKTIDTYCFGCFKGTVDGKLHCSCWNKEKGVDSNKLLDE